MTQFHEGQEVEVFNIGRREPDVWRKAKIVDAYQGKDFETYVVEFVSGVQVAFDAGHVRAVEAQHDAHLGDYWKAARSFVAMQLHGGLDPFTGKGEFERPPATAPVPPPITPSFNLANERGRN